MHEVIVQISNNAYTLFSITSQLKKDCLVE